MSENQTETESVEQPAGNRWVSWIAVGIAFLFLSFLVFFTATFNAQQRAQVECHSLLMNDLHSKLGEALDKYPEDDLGWVQEWHADFEQWERELEACTGHQGH